MMIRYVLVRDGHIFKLEDDSIVTERRKGF